MISAHHDSVSADLRGAFGDLAWAYSGAAFASSDPLALIPADLAELARQRLLLSGYDLVAEPAPSASKWASPAGAVLILVESDATWLHPALNDANRNRDRFGTPILTLPHELLLRLDHLGERDELQAELRLLSPSQQSTAQTALQNLAPELLTVFDNLLTGA